VKVPALRGCENASSGIGHAFGSISLPVFVLSQGMASEAMMPPENNTAMSSSF
jgi:hypothetical protein